MYPIGLSSCAFALTEENFEQLNAVGVDAIEISMKLDGHRSLDCRQTAALADRCGIRLWSYHLPFSPFREIRKLGKNLSHHRARAPRHRRGSPLFGRSP